MAAHALVETGKQQQQQQQNKNPTTAINQVHNVFVLVRIQVVWPPPLKKAQYRTLLSPSQIMDATTTSESAVPGGGGGEDTNPLPVHKLRAKDECEALEG